MNLQDFHIGTKIEIEVTDDGTGQSQKEVLVSQFEYINNGMRAIIGAPFLRGTVYQIHEGATIFVYVYKGSELYKFKATVINRIRVDNSIPALEIEKKGEIDKIQRRGFFRFDCTLKVRYRCIDNENKQFIDSYTKDISGGGIRVLLREKTECKHIEFELCLDEGIIIKFTGTVQRVFDRENDDKYRFEAGILFNNIENKDRENIIKFVFNEQRKLRKKGLI